MSDEKNHFTLALAKIINGMIYDQMATISEGCDEMKKAVKLHCITDEEKEIAHKLSFYINVDKYYENRRNKNDLDM